MSALCESEQGPVGKSPKIHCDRAPGEQQAGGDGADTCNRNFNIWRTAGRNNREINVKVSSSIKGDAKRTSKHCIGERSGKSQKQCIDARGSGWKRGEDKNRELVLIRRATAHDTEGRVYVGKHLGRVGAGRAFGQVGNVTRAAAVKRKKKKEGGAD